MLGCLTTACVSFMRTVLQERIVVPGNVLGFLNLGLFICGLFL